MVSGIVTEVTEGLKKEIAFGSTVSEVAPEEIPADKVARALFAKS